MRCEDFPCCGHYEAATGETFCYEATRTEAERKRDEAIEAAERQYAEDVAYANRAEAYEAAPDDHNDFVCDGFGDNCPDCGEYVTFKANPCKGCLEEAEDNDRQFEQMVRDGDYPDPYDY